MPISAAPAAPAKRTARKPVSAPLSPSSRTAHREKELTSTVKGFSLVALMRGYYADAGALVVHGPPIAHELAELAESNEKIGNWVDYIIEAGPYMGLAVAVLTLGMQLAVNHGKFDSSKLPPSSGILPPDLLEKKMRADIEEARHKLEQEYALANGSKP